MDEPRDFPTLADRIRRHVFDKHVLPAKSRGMVQIMLRAGDVHGDMGLVSRMPAVCSALGNKFEQDYGVELVERSGPVQGANVYFTFRVLEPARTLGFTPQHATSSEIDGVSSDGAVAVTRVAARPKLEAEDIYLVSCVSRKRNSAMPAKDLYASTWFVNARDYVEQRGAAWLILSAKYGIVHPDQVIEPYATTLNHMPIEQRRLWAAGVIKQLLEQAPDFGTVVFLAGARYREFLIHPLEEMGIRVRTPMLSLPIGMQLSWLGR